MDEVFPVLLCFFSCPDDFTQICHDNIGMLITERSGTGQWQDRIVVNIRDIVLVLFAHDLPQQAGFFMPYGLDGIGKSRICLSREYCLEVFGQEVICAVERIHGSGFQDGGDILGCYRLKLHLTERDAIIAQHIAEPVQHGHLSEVHDCPRPHRDGQPSALQVFYGTNRTVRSYKDAAALFLERDPQQHTAVTLGSGPERRNVAALAEDQRIGLGKV